MDINSNNNTLESINFSIGGISINDPLDQIGFDPVSLVNQRFPTEASLEDLDAFALAIGAQVSTLDEEIAHAVQAQSLAGQQASKDISDAQKAIEELFVKINDIKSKAAQSERMVQEICADIKKLDYAKTHLQASITSLKRLQMLITAVGQLEVLANEYQYRDAANLLDAVKQLLLHFDKYTNIPLMSDMIERVNHIQGDLRKHVHYAFREIGQMIDNVADVSLMLNDLPGNMKSLSDACLVVDALGVQARRELLEEFVQLQLIPYETLFGAGKPHFALDQVDRRWAWFKRLLKSYDSKFNTIFPAHWRMALRLCLEFTERTKIHLVLLLTEMESKDQSDVHLLLKALQTALRFEQEMSARFGVTKGGEKDIVPITANNETHLDTLQAKDLILYRPTDHNAIEKVDEEESGFIGLAHAAISGGISDVFDKFLGPYVLLERSNLEELLQRLSQEEDTAQGGEDSEGGSSTSNCNVYGSSMSMFVFIKNSIKRCTALTNGLTFLSLTKEFKACMTQYAEMLRSRCPIIIGQGTAQYVKLINGAEVGVCYLVNTGEYCAEVVPQLEQMIQQKILPSLSNKVDLQSEVDIFTDLVAHAMKTLVLGVMDRLDSGFKVMSNINWSTVPQVGEESQYIHTFNAILTESVPKIRESLSGTYFTNFCTKIATDILGKYLDIILKQKRISDTGSQQLLLDTYSLKTLLMHMQHLGIDASNSANSSRLPVPPMYLKLITSRAAHIEMILKLLGTPEEMLVDRFKAVWPEGSPNDLLTLMSIKGMKKPEQQTLLESFPSVAAASITTFNSSMRSFSSNINATTQRLGTINWTTK